MPKFQKVSGARRMAQHLSRERNRSGSFQAFVAGVETVAAGLAANTDAAQRMSTANEPGTDTNGDNQS